MRSIRTWLSVAVPLVCAAAIVGCGSSNSSSSTSSAAAAPTSSTSSAAATSTAASSSAAPAGADATVVALVPSAIKSKGTLTVAADASYAPNEFFAPDGHTVIGMDADLSKALAAVMGLKASVVRTRRSTASFLGPGGGQVRHGRLFVHRHPGEGEGRQLRRLLLGGYVVLHEDLGWDVRDRARGPVRQDRRGREGQEVDRGDRREGPGRASARRAASPRPSPCSRSPDQNGANLALSSGRAQISHGGLPGRRLPGQAVAGQVQARRPDLRDGALRHRAPENRQ